MKLQVVLTGFIAMSLSGCGNTETSVTTDMHEDFDHDHKHQHTGDDDHEHHHKDGFTGSHSHSHSHSHRHGEPLHGGRIVSIGHTHHKSGATHFHAEVMPLSEDEIRFHILTESDDGVSRDYPIAVSEIPALIGIKDREATSAEGSFTGVSDGDEVSEFTMKIPESLSTGEVFSVVVPKLKLGGMRQNFSFTISRKTISDATPASNPEEASQEPRDE